MSTVFVRGFDFGTTEAQIKKYCSKAGPVTAVEMQGRGAATVTYASAEKAEHAVATLDSTTMPGNTRYIDVKMDEGGKKGIKRKAGEGSCRVFVRGFDFGTTDEQFESHCGNVGTIEKVHWCTKGSAIVIYSSPEEAEAAVNELQGTTIEGNSRFIDVMLKDEEDDHRPAKKGKGMQKGGGKGKDKGMWVFQPFEAAPMPMPFWQRPVPGRMPMAMPMMAIGNGKGKGKGKKEDPPGSGRVFVRGFDFGTDDEVFYAHMQTMGPLETVHWISKGSAIVVYKKKASAVKAASQLNQSVIDGNTRYIDVVMKDSE